MVYSRLAKRLRVLGFGRFGDYLAQLEDREHPEWEHFVNALTTNQTDFFREAHHFALPRGACAHDLRPPHARLERGRPRDRRRAVLDRDDPVRGFETLMPPVEILATDLGHACPRPLRARGSTRSTR
jgi:chemotaxis protein methyltransferase CheR